MKNKLLLLSFGLLMTTQMIFSQVPSYVPSNGLVGYWPFSGNANDQSGNGNNGTVNGATLTTDRFGNANSAYSFDGNNFTRISVPNAPSLNLINDFTISSWINGASYEASTTTVRMIISKSGDGVGNPNGYNYGIWGDESITNNEIGSVNFQAQPYNDPSTYPNGSLGLIQINNWYNFVVTYTKSSSTLKYYINNVLIDTKNLAFNIGDNTNELWIGSQASIYNTVKTFNGKIDDVGIWNRALTPQEITNLYNGVSYSDTCNAVSGSLTQGLVGYWPFCGNANDDSGNGNNGTVNGATLTTDRFGNANSAYSFDGVDDNINLGVNPNISLLPNTNLSISLWFKNINNSGAFISKYRNGVPDDSSFFIGSTWNNEIHFGGNGTAPFPICNSIPNSDWNNMTILFYGGNAQLYLNGIYYCNANFPINTTLSNLPLILGSTNCPINDPNCNFLNGQLDDIGIWNRTLTPQEITQLYNQNQCFTNITVTDTLVINVGQLSFTNPISYSNNITIAPNPASTQININFNNITDLNGGSIKIINSLGQQVATTPITATGTNTSMQLNTWGGTGMYFVQILNGQGIVVDVKKIILQ